MDLGFAAGNLLSPPILFFLLGVLAVLVRSDLGLPAPTPKVLSLFLLLAIGFKGGVALRQTPGDQALTVVLVLASAVAASALVPLAAYTVLRRRLPVPDAAAVAACYGSVSAVTFVTAVAFLRKSDVEFGGYMVATMALMESPAVIVGVLLARRGGPRPAGSTHAGDVRDLVREAFLNGPVVLLIGAMLVGWASNPAGSAALLPPLLGLFDVALAVFLLDMGLVAARQFSELRNAGLFPISFGLLAPPAQACLGLGLSAVLGLGPGDALLLTVLVASASYIAVPAAVRLAIPDARPSLYIPMTLAVTFPLNIVVGIPVYWAVISYFW